MQSKDLSYIDSYKGVLFYRNDKLSTLGIDCVYLRGKAWAGYTYISRLVMKDSNFDWRDVAIQMVMEDALSNR